MKSPFKFKKILTIRNFLSTPISNRNELDQFHQPKAILIFSIFEKIKFEQIPNSFLSVYREHHADPEN